MKVKLFIGLTLAILVFGGNIFAATKPKITMEQAAAIALKRVSGEVEQSDLVEKHHKAIYSFFIMESDGVTAHVLVSEKGRIKRVADETPATAKIK